MSRLSAESVGVQIKGCKNCVFSALGPKNCVSGLQIFRATNKLEVLNSQVEMTSPKGPSISYSFFYICPTCTTST